MADMEVRINVPDGPDIEMQGGDSADVVETGTADAQGEDDTEAIQGKPSAPRVTFVEYFALLSISSLLKAPS